MLFTVKRNNGFHWPAVSQKSTSIFLPSIVAVCLNNVKAKVDLRIAHAHYNGIFVLDSASCTRMGE